MKIFFAIAVLRLSLALAKPASFADMFNMVNGHESSPNALIPDMSKLTSMIQGAGGAAPSAIPSGGDAGSINLPQLFKGIPLLGDMETQFVSYLVLLFF